MNCMNISCIHVRGQGTGKLDDRSRKMDEWNFDLVGVTETHLKEDTRVDGEVFAVTRKGRKQAEHTWRR